MERKFNLSEILEAIQKQIPLPPANFEINGSTVTKASCPRCKYNFPDIGGVSEYYGEVEQYEYCPECGQKIEWKT